MRFPVQTLAACAALITGGAHAASLACKAESAATLTPVIELYTSEGCSSRLPGRCTTR